MARLSWRGVDRHVRRLHGSCHADSARVLIRVLEARGITVLRVHRELRLLPRRSTPRSAEQATALRQLASLLEAGAPFDEALRTLAQQQAHRLRESLRHVRLGVEHGEDPATAFSRALPGLSQAHTALLHASLWTGDLPGALRSIAAEIERQEAILHQLRRAAIYPAIVAGTVLALLTLLLLDVVPRFEAIFAQGGAVTATAYPARDRGCRRLRPRCPHPARGRSNDRRGAAPPRAPMADPAPAPRCRIAPHP
ncbi:MAG: type II secretion system F family protein [Halorhodospira sp.]